jgi:hypothetical protein
MTNISADTYHATIPPQSQGSDVDYQIVVIDDSANNNTTTGSYSFLVLDPCAGDNDGPEITMSTPLPDTYDEAGPYVPTFDVMDDCGISLVNCEYRVNGGAWLVSGVTYLGGYTYMAYLPGQPAGSLVEYALIAMDDSPNFNLTRNEWSFNVLIPETLDTPVLTIAQQNATRMRLNWTSVSGASSYQVLFSSDGVTYEHLLYTSATQQTINFGLGQMQFFRVIALN